MAASRIVIIGAGLAGAKAVEALRGQGFAGSITLIGEEEHRPYEGPPLSKDYLAGKAEQDSVFVHEEGWYAEHAIDLRLGVAATAIDRVAHEVELADGTRVTYDKLLVATGSRPRTLPDAPVGAQGVHYLRRFEDADEIKRLLTGDGHLVMIGAGWIGLEVAAVARQAGLRMTVLEALELPLLRVLGREIAQVFADLHRANGVDLRLGVAVDDITTDSTGKASGVRLGDGTHIETDAIVVGVGAAANTELAVRAGLSVENGVVVDAGRRRGCWSTGCRGGVRGRVRPGSGRCQRRR